MTRDGKIEKGKTPSFFDEKRFGMAD